MRISYTARDGGDVFRGTIESKLMSAVSDYFGTGQALENLISIKHTMSDEWARLANTDGEESYRRSVNLALDNFPYYLPARGIKITKLKLALTGEVDVSGWERAALPGIADDEGNQPYAVNFTEDTALGLKSASFRLPGGFWEPSIDVDLPAQLVGTIGGQVGDVLVICSYELKATSE